MSPEGSLHGTKALNRKWRERTMFTEEQLQELRRCFEHDRYPSARERQALAHKLNLGEYSVKIWFKNQRAKLSRANSRMAGQHPQVQDSQPICLPSASTSEGQPRARRPAVCSPRPTPPAPAPMGPARPVMPQPHSARSLASGPAPGGPESSQEPSGPAPALTEDSMDFGLPRDHLPLFPECMDLLEMFVSDIFTSGKHPEIPAQLDSCLQEAETFVLETCLDLMALWSDAPEPQL